MEEKVREDAKTRGDTQIIFKNISRFSRRAEKAFKEYMELYNLGVKLVFLDNTTVSTD